MSEQPADQPAGVQRSGLLEKILLVTAAYFVAGYAGLQFPYFGSTVTLIWPPTGIAIAALLCWGMRVWPGIALGAAAVNLTTGVPIETVFLITIGNSVSGVAGAWMVRKICGEYQLATFRSFIWFMVLAVLASPLISSLNGAAVVSFTLSGHWNSFFDIWWGWWVGDLMGVLLFAPPLICLHRGALKDRALLWKLELGFLTLGAVAISILVHTAEILARQEFLFIFVSLPFALWGALRFGLFGAAMVNLAVSMTAILYLALGQSFFIHGGQQDSLIRFYGYFCLIGVSSLMLSLAMEHLLNKRQGNVESVFAERVKRMRIILALSAGALGLSLSIAAATISHDQIIRTEKLELQNHLTAFESELSGSLDQALDPLYSIKALFETQPDVPREIFSSLIRPWLDRVPSVQALEWVPRVTESQRFFFETLAQEDGLEGFHFKEKSGDIMVPAGNRDIHYPVYYVVPLEGNEAALGFDLASSEARWRAMNQAIQRDQVSISEPISLVQGDIGEQAVLVFLPVTRKEDGRNLGFALGVYRLNALISSVYESARLPKDLVVHVVDFSAPLDRQLLFSTAPRDFELHHGSPDHDSHTESQLRYQLHFGGRNWTISFEAPHGAHGLTWNWQPWAIFVVGSILSGALSLYLMSLTRTEERIALLVRQRTQAMHEAQLETEAALHQAQQASQAKSEFLAHMSHELRSPLNSILGYAELTLNDKDIHGLPDRARDYVSTIISSGKHLLDLIGDVLDLSKVEAGQLVLEQVSFNLKSLVEEQISMLVLPARENNNSVELDLPEDLHEWVIGDPVRLRQILTNFLSNALKFTRNGSIHLILRRQDEDENQILLRFIILDTGIGISPEKQENLFDAFTQADMSTTREYGGTGLGLAINKRLVSTMGGKIGLHSKPGEGSEFWFDLELQKSGPVDNVTLDFLSASVRPLHMLLAEDIEINRLMAKRMLENAGHQVDTAVDGHQVVEMAEKGDYDVILMDIHMPGMDGMEATRKIRAFPDARHRELPIVALTADIASSNIEEYIACGMDDYCAKPLNLDALARVLSGLGFASQRHMSSDTAAPADHAADIDSPPADSTPLVNETKLSEVLIALPDCIQMFRQQTETTRETFEDLMEQQDRGEIRKQAHALKGVALSLGLDRLSAACADLEELSGQEDVDITRLEPPLQALNETLNETLQALPANG